MEHGHFAALRLWALGAYPPLMIAYLTEILRPARRGMLILDVVVAPLSGPLPRIFLVRWLADHPMAFEAGGGDHRWRNGRCRRRLRL